MRSLDVLLLELTDSFARHRRLTIGFMLELEVVFGDEAEMVWTDIFESADPSTFFCKATDDLAC